LLKTTTALAAALVCACPALAQQAPATELPELTNTATRTERRVADTPATISLHRTTADVRDLKDLLRHEVDVSVRAANPRFGLALGATGRAGNEDINIRGLEGNQVLILVDGIRMPQGFSFGPFITGRAGLLNIEGASAAEILRGPTSTSFGSDGLAGLLSLRTLEAKDLLGKDKSFAVRAQLAAHSGDDGLGLNLAGAWKSGGVDVLLQGSTRRSHETETRGENEAENSSRTAPEPLERQRATVLGKLGIQLAAAQRLQFTVEGVDQQDRWDVLSARSATVLRLDADDHSRRQRGSLAWVLDDLNAGFIQQASVNVYHQRSQIRQWAFEDRSPAVDRTRDNRYEEALSGLAAQASSSQGSHRFSAGLDASRNTISALRDGTTPPAGEVFPAKPFPDTDYRLLGAFVQGELNFGALQAVPALRYERFSLSPSASGYGGAVVKLSDAALTPRLGLLWRATPAFVPYLQWAKGFKAPTPTQVNSAFSNPLQGYTSIGNPMLKAEKADSREIGLRGEAGALRWQVAVFDNAYEDFISQETVGGTGAPGNPLIFQSINLAGAKIRGLETRVDWQPASGWKLGLSYAQTQGTSERNGVEAPLDQVEPAKLGLHLRQQLGQLNWQVDLLHARAKPASRVSAATPFLTPAYTVLDLAAGWQINPTWSLQARIDNATDRKYWRWSDARGLAASSTTLDAFTAPGRQFGLVLQATL
jgi:hemoglobin/transferrin/lactoferrin receptor protein